jgi:hypothetical protein
MHLILPKTFPVTTHLRSVPLFFLAGPILGGGDWQHQMSTILAQRFDECIIVNPSRYEPSHPLYAHSMAGGGRAFERQTDWERYYLQQAADEWPTGCIIFWLACENKKTPRVDGLSYAMDTRGELGEWRGRMMHNRDLRVVIGAETDFPGLSQVVRNFEYALGPTFVIHDTMENVVDQAAFFAHPRLSFKTRVSA